MSVLRRILHYFRKGCYRILGVQPMMETFMPYMDARMERMIDRICLLESQVNWRMHGLPAPFANVKLEHLGSLLGQDEIRDLLKKSQDLRDSTALLTWFEKENFSTKSIVVGSPALFGKNEKILTVLSQLTLICDPEDIMSVLWFKNVPKTWRCCLHTDILTFLLGVDDSSSDIIWLGDALNRLSPLKALLVIKHAYRVLQKNGKMGGLRHSQNIISQFDYHFDWKSLSAVDIVETALTLESEVWTIVKK